MIKLRINKDFADKYNSTQKKLELQKLKDKYKNGEHISDSSTSESEDDNAEALTDEIEKDWFCTLSAIIGKDPKIYDPSVKFYHDESNLLKKQKKDKKAKTIYLKDYERSLILNHEGKLPDGMSASSGGVYNKEQQEIKEGFKPFFESSDEEDDDIMTKRDVTNQEKEKQEKEYIEWMKGQKVDVADDVVKELVPLKGKWFGADIDAGDEFLKDYLLNKRYLDEDDERLPTYDEIVLTEADEEQFEREEIFALKFNYRYEEPDQEFIKNYPRTVTDTVRLKDDRRTQKRKEVKDRKDSERKKKKEELKKLKNLKKEEMLGKMRRLQEVIGHTDIQLRQEDLETDFDPLKHEEVMRQLLGDTFYEEEGADHKKPTFYDRDIDDEEVDWDHFTREDILAENDYNMQDAEASLASTNNRRLEDDFLDRSRKKRRRRSKFLDAIERSKPLFDPKSETFDKYFDEYYNLDYEDIIADQPCRFRYRKVVANDFGLTTDEILKAREKELNAWVSVKKMSQYRPENEEFEDLNTFKKKFKKKYKILTSLNESLLGESPKISNALNAVRNIKTSTKISKIEQSDSKNQKPKKAKSSKSSDNNESDKFLKKQIDQCNVKSKKSEINQSSLDHKHLKIYNDLRTLSEEEQCVTFDGGDDIQITSNICLKKKTKTKKPSNCLNNNDEDSNVKVELSSDNNVVSKKRRKKKKVPTATLR